MSKVNGFTVESKEGIDKLYEVTWEERHLMCAKIWAKSPEEAIDIAKREMLRAFVEPAVWHLGDFPDSYRCENEIEGASKDCYKPSGTNFIEIEY